MLSFQNARADVCTYSAYVGGQPGLQYVAPGLQMGPRQSVNAYEQSPIEMPTFTLQEIRKAQAEQCLIR